MGVSLMFGCSGQELIFTGAVDEVLFIVHRDGISIPCSSSAVAEANANYYRRLGASDVSVEERHSHLNCGEVYL